MDNKNNNPNNNNANSQNPVQSYGGAPEGAYSMGVGVDGSLNQNAYGGPGNGLRMENALNQAPENQSMNQNLPKGGKSSKKMLIMWVVIAVLAMAALGVGIWALVSQHQTESGDKQQESTEDKDDEQKEEKIEELAVDDTLVQDLYQRFEGAKNPWEGKWNFYVDEEVAKGAPSRYLMMTLAKQRLATLEKQQICKGSYEYTYNDGTTVALTNCYSGEDMRSEIAEMFGQKLDFTAEDVAGTICGGYRYNVDNDEFHEVEIGCGGSWPASIVGKVVKAEKKGDNLYIYEKALMNEATGLYKIDGKNENLTGEFVGNTIDPNYDLTAGSAEEYQELVRQNTDKFLDSDGDTYKWTFAKNADGEYVFAGLEKIEE